MLLRRQHLDKIVSDHLMDEKIVDLKMIVLNHFTKSTLSDIDVSKFDVHTSNSEFHETNCLQIVLINDKIML